MNQEILKQAVRNNAEWCDLICALHNAPGEFHTDIWMNNHITPPFYPNLITLNENAEGITEAINELVSLGKVGKFGVKDSFCNLALDAQGFTKLFTAEWIYKSANQSLPTQGSTKAIWHKMETAEDLKNWEIAWNGDKEPEERIFLTKLLENKDVVILAASIEGKIVAGGIANKSKGVVGISNIFTPSDNQRDFWKEFTEKVSKEFPSLLLVGYESDDSLTIAKELGFESIGKLQIWEN